jgi:hydrogenase expression/formation protein HypE
MAHGAGGRFTQQLIDDVFSAAMGSVQTKHDGAVLDPTGSAASVLTTDSYVVKPLFFPGGDIAKLAVTGTCNDLAMCGAEPEYLSCGWIIEEGFATEQLYRLACSMAAAAMEVGAQVVTGDTKVVDRGHGDGVYLNVTGVGRQRLSSHPDLIAAGDVILVSGDIGRHGCAILTQREDLQLATEIRSDCAHLWPTVAALAEAGVELHCLRDLTRGGLATALAELSGCSGLQFTIERDRVPVSAPVASACELFGLDPLYTANEGRMLAIVPEASAAAALTVLSGQDENAARIGMVAAGEGVIARSSFGSDQILDLLSGEQLPRIC